MAAPHTRIPRIRFRHLQCFLTIAQLRSVGAAADELSITQPALSKTLRELEEALGVKLFERNKSGMALTHFGNVFLQHAAASIGALRHGIDSIRLAREAGGLGVTIGVLPNVAAQLIPQAVHRFKGQASRTTVNVVTGDNAVLLGRLRLGDIDLVVGRLAQPEHMTGLMFEQLYSEPLTVVVRRGHPLAGVARFTIAQALAYPIVLPRSGTIIRDEIDRYAMAAGVRLSQDVVETTSIAFGLGYLAVANAVWFVPRGAVQQEIAERRIVELMLDDPALLGPVGITMSGDAPRNAARALMAQAIRETARDREADNRTVIGAGRKVILRRRANEKR